MFKKQILVCAAAFSILISTIPIPSYQICADTPEKNHETITFGKDNQRSSHYTMKDGEITLTIASVTGNGSFRSSLVDSSNPSLLKYITTTSYGDAWYTNATGSDPTPTWTSGENADEIIPGHIYEAHYVKEDNNYTITYYDYTDDVLLYEYTANSTDVSTNLYAYVNALAGSFYISEGSPAEQGYAIGDTAEMLSATHGLNRDTYVQKNQLKETIPDDYTINKDVQAPTKEGQYNSFFLKEDLQTVSVTMDAKNLDFMLQNAATKSTVMADEVTIGDTSIGYVGMRAKGNYTRTHTESSTSDRFSFSINFGKYINKNNGFEKRQNFYGLSKVSFNNFFFDKTMMKEYNALRLLSEMGLPTPQYGLAKLYINGDYYGVYSMIESFDSSILEQYYNVSGKELSNYLAKPTNYSPRYYGKDLDAFKDENGEFTMESLLKGAIIQNEDNTYSPGEAILGYSGLWENKDEMFQEIAEELPNVFNWLYRLTALSEGKDFQGNEIDVNSEEYITLLSQVMDVDETVKYFATHSFLCQMDNLFTWHQNYGLYINESAQSLMIPWDYDLAWGCDGDPATGEAVANFQIDKLYNNIAQAFSFYSDDLTEFYGGADWDEYSSNPGHPLFYVIYQNDSLMEKFHTYMEDCSKICALGGTTSQGESFEPGRFANTIDAISDKVITAASETLAENVTYLNYSQPASGKDGLPSLKQIIALRAVGVYLQTNQIDAHVTGYGYKQGNLGNDANMGIFTTSGKNIACVDTDTGIFAIADYDESKGGPKLSITKLDASNSVYQEIANKLSSKDDTLTVYHIQNEKKPISDYQLYLPVTQNYSTAGANVYYYHSEDDSLNELSAEKKDNMYIVNTSDISYIAVHAPTATKVKEQVHKEQGNFWIYTILGLSVGMTILFVIYRTWKRKKVLRGKNSQNS